MKLCAAPHPDAGEPTRVVVEALCTVALAIVAVAVHGDGTSAKLVQCMVT